MNKNKTFNISIKIWWSEFLNMCIFLCISLIIFLISFFILGNETIGLYSTYLKLFIILLGYIGVFLGAYNSFKKIKKNKAYISRKVKYIVCFFELILFLLFGYICFMNKLNVYFFISGYLLIFFQFVINYIFIRINNKKYHKNDNSTKKDSTSHIKQTGPNEFIIDINKLK